MREESRPLGVVYTPPEVAGPMVRLVVDALARGKSAAEVLALRVCDPAIGAGAFLIEVVDALADHLATAWGDESRRAEARQRIATTCIAGVDVDPAAIAATRKALARGAARPGTEQPGTEPTDPVQPGAGAALRCADALELDWRAAYPEVFARGGFDLVVGNPPYIRQERLGGKPALRKYASYDGVADLYVYFVELAHQVLRPGGMYCLIVPNKWLTAAYGRPLRTYLAAQGSVDGVVDLGRSPLFADADAFPCIVWGTAGREREAWSRAPLFGVRAEIGATVADVLADASARVGLDAPHGAGSSGARPSGAGGAQPSGAGGARPSGAGGAQVRARWGAGPWHIDRPSERALLDRIERELPPLGEVVRTRPSRGVVTGCNRAFVIDRATRDRIVGEEPAAAALLRPFVKGRDLAPWRIVAAERWIVLVDRGTSLDELPVVRAHLAQFRGALEPRPAGWSGGAWRGRKPGTYGWHELQDPVGPLIKARAPRLLYQDIQTAPACALDRDGDAVPDTTVWMLPTDDRFLLAVLCSPLYGWYARRRFPPALNGAVRPKGEYMQTLPIAQPDPAARHAIGELVDRRIAAAPGEATELDAAIMTAVSDAYRLSSAERELINAR